MPVSHSKCGCARKWLKWPPWSLPAKTTATLEPSAFITRSRRAACSATGIAVGVAAVRALVVRGVRVDVVRLAMGLW